MINKNEIQTRVDNKVVLTDHTYLSNYLFQSLVQEQIVHLWIENLNKIELIYISSSRKQRKESKNYQKYYSQMSDEQSSEQLIKFLLFNLLCIEQIF